MDWVNFIIISSVCCFVITVTFGFVGFSGILNYVVKDQTALRRRNMVRKFYQKLPIPLEFSVYFFNVTNPREAEQGKIPVLDEIGPYCYDAYKEKVDIIDNDAEDSLSYIPYETYFFNEERSLNLRQDDYVTIINPLVVGIVNSVVGNPKQAPLLPIVSKAITLLFNDPKSIYMSVKVRDILFDGIVINCTLKDYPVRALCPRLKIQLAELIVEREKDVYLFSILGQKNGTIPKRFKVLRGIKKSADLGRVIEYDDKKRLTIWGSRYCNKFRGTDGWIFPPLRPKEEGIWVFAYDLCRNIFAQYIEEGEYHGIAVRKYYATLGDMSSVPEDKCYCPTLKTCLPKGIMDLTNCLGVPIYASLPHFAAGDKRFLKLVKGLNPDMDKHAVRIMFEYMTGTPMEAHKRMQFNLPVKSVKKLKFMERAPECMHPIFWVQEAVQLKGGLLRMILNIFLLLKIITYVKYFFLLTSTIGIVAGVYLRFKRREKQTIITPVTNSIAAISATDTDIVLHSRTNSSTSSTDKNTTYVKHFMSGHEFDKFKKN